jgi:pSer/pThr/pTyr-binding forkhead associated (FHA) protein/ribosomal protein L40E
VPNRTACTACGIDNPTGAKFCRECGANLPAAGALPQALASSASNQAARDPAVGIVGVGKDAPLGGTLVVASRPPEPYVPKKELDIAGTLASAPNIPMTSPPVTPEPHARRAMEHSPSHHDSSHHSASLEKRPAANPQGTFDPPGESRGDAPLPPALGGPGAKQAVASAASPAGRTCRACGATSGASARFCQLCGLPLERGSGERPRSNPPEIVAQSVPDAELVVIAQDGSPGRRYPLAGLRTTIGSSDADISLRKDPYVSPLHAQISYRNGRFYLEDCGSLNGVFVRLGGSVPLTSGDLLLLGLGVLRFEIVDESERNLAPQSRNGTRVFGTPPAPRYARLTTQTVEGVARDRYYLSRAETVLGREVGDIVFTDDPFMSRRHAAIRRDPNTNHFAIRDLGSSNGTFIALRTEHALSPGDHIRVGQHLFRLDVRSGR